MSNERKISHGINLNVAIGSKPTIFIWKTFPENIVKIEALESGSAKLTTKSLNTDGKLEVHEHDVMESKEEIERRITICKELDEKCKNGNHAS
jgi:hypothetical protein